ncbi:hypothetical protein KNP414_00281 [Paenibacillus mucilaginosus KNP414]|uniref:Uncharacterized protein n=2 Tax=Paenibacillus mucilaginosus TaxID=61624 RepID=F8FM98_PAEMK|nr:hypothetical protein KNP414_00281 [Paenibacillus mucilaginosus KNP414]
MPRQRGRADRDVKGTARSCTSLLLVNAGLTVGFLCPGQAAAPGPGERLFVRERPFIF